MHIKILMTTNASQAVANALNNVEFATAIHETVLPTIGVTNATDKPGAYIVEKPTLAIPTTDEKVGVQVLVTGVTATKDRDKKAFKAMLNKLTDVTTKAIDTAIEKDENKTPVNLFVQVQLDTAITIDGEKTTLLEQEFELDLVPA